MRSVPAADELRARGLDAGGKGGSADRALGGGYTAVQALAGYRAPLGWSLALYVENLLDDEYFDSEGGVSSASSPFVQSDISPSRPRTAGVRFSWNL